MEPAGYSVGFVLAIAIMAIVAGLIVGLLMGRRTSGAARRYRDIALKLDQVMQDKKSYEAEVLNFVEQVLLHGSAQASRQMAELSYLLMSEGNRARFESWAQELPPNSLKRELFEASLHRAYP